MILTYSNGEEWLDYRKKHKLPHPPFQDRKIKQAGIYWLVYYPEESGSANAPSLTIKQWSPVHYLWFNVDELSTNAKGLTMEGWHVQEEIKQVWPKPMKELLEENAKRWAF